MTNPHQALARERKAFTLFVAARVKGLSSEDITKTIAPMLDAFGFFTESWEKILERMTDGASLETWQRVVEMLREMEVAEMEGAMR